ncbi:hypothetical protein KAK07_13990 [Ideonella sp. 4Y16]|uniref:Outer membrane protein beta-barrel domain-containing protein n=1 Tax=Ideonella alba TaxID=2824118 RepID=A0A941BFP7_9BURK|nr:hypothetical protein [Ideonella alba]MBQ0932296.1 hypothetical protein [Ideonella alba]MBQ0944446.1 hypothetical protein [Ideonella alba]
MRANRSITVCLAALAALSSAQAAPVGDGLQLTEPSSWTSWQTHLSIVTVSPPVPASLVNTPVLGAARVSSDLFFDLGRLGDGGGLRATGALLLGSRSLALGAASTTTLWRSVGLPDNPADSAATPYVGVGYSAWWTRAGVGLSADLGLMAQRPGQGLRALTGGSGLDNTVRAMQLSPVFQLNLSYAF